MADGELSFFDLDAGDEPEWDDLLSVEDVAEEVGADVQPERAISSSEISHRVIRPILAAIGWDDTNGYQYRVGRKAGGQELDVGKYPTLIPVNGVSLHADFVVVEDDWGARDPPSREYPLVGEIKEAEATSATALLKDAVDDASRYVRLTRAPIGVISNGQYLGIVLQLRDPRQSLLEGLDADEFVDIVSPENVLDEDWRVDLMMRANVPDPEARRKEAEEEAAARTLIAYRPISQISDTLDAIHGNIRDDIESLYEEIGETDYVEGSFQSWLQRRSNMPATMREADAFLQESVYDLTIKLLTTKVTRDYELVRREDPDEYVYDGTLENVRDYVAEIQGTSTVLPALGMDVLSWWIPTQERYEELTDDQREAVDDRLGSVDGYVGNARDELEQYDTTQLDRDELGYIYERHLPAERRRIMGEYYTPVRVVDHVLAEIGYGDISQELVVRGADGDWDVKTILDSSCGSGTFLVRAARLLRGWLELREDFQVETEADADELLEMIERGICGLDINPFAVTLAEINLFITNIDLIEQSSRENIEFNVYTTDSLQRGEFESGPLSQYLDRGNHRAQTQRRPIEGADEVKDVEHEFVVGNPPHTSRFSEADYSDVLDLYGGVDNTATAFWRRIIRDFTTDDGAIGLVMPMDFVTGYDAGADAREWLAERDMEVVVIDPAYYEAFHTDSRIAKVGVLCQK